jgi:ABC-type antimicrobial peptide transport system permease subunit
VRRYSDQYLYGKYENGRQAGGRIEYVRIFSVVAIFILVIACINFMNLATAKASKRLKEIGIKKTVGALRKTLVLQFLAESILTALLSAVVAVIWVYLLLPAFNNITGKALGLDFNYSVLSSLLLITLIAGLIAGSYPALYLSRFKPVDVLKGQSRPFGSDALVRKGLVVFQFAISIILIVAVLVVKRQVDFIQSKNLGYSTDHIIYFGKGGEVNGNKESDMEAFIHELKAIPGVVNAANLGYDITGSNGTTSLSWTGKNPDNQTQFHMLHAGYDLLETLNYKLVEGRTFSRAFGPSEKSKIILNNTAVQVMRLTDPVGKTVKWGDKSYEIIGVVEDFNFESVYEKVKPCFFDLVPGYSNVVVKISAGKEKKTINQLQQYYKAEVGFTLNFKFLNEQYQKLYEAENRLAALSQYFAGVAILISCLGLFGLAAFTAEKRRKEIGMRKVLGATVLQIVLLLSKDFLLLVVIAIFIGFPIAIWASSSWLQDFAYSAQINWWLYAFAAGAAIVIGLLTVTSQAINAAITNPVKSLRAE